MRRFLTPLALFALAAAPAAAHAQAKVWDIDVTHSELGFKVRHLVSRVPGTFTQWSGSITADPANLAGGSVEVTIQTPSITTYNERRDAHLKSPDFFDVAGHPTMTFKSAKVELNGTAMKVYGTLTMRGVSKPVVLEGQFLGSTGTGENQRVGFTAKTTINRMDFGVSWNRAAEGGGLVLSENVEIELTVAATPRKS